MTDHTGPAVATNGKLQVINCKQCGFAHLDPLPDPETVQRYYREEDGLYTRFSPQQFWKEAKEYQHGWWDAAFRFQQYLLQHWGFFCDIGAGAGWFMDHWNWLCDYIAWGIEPSYKARLFGEQQLDLRIAPDWHTLMARERRKDQGAGFGGGGVHQMHSMRMCLVLEHVADPRTFLLETINYLRPAGRLLIIVPNEMNPLQQRIKGYGDWWVSPVHINYFTADSLRKLLTSLGLHVTYEGTTFPMELFHLLGIHYIGHERLGRLCHWTRLVFERFVGPKVFLFYQKLYKRYGWGRELMFLAYRP